MSPATPRGAELPARCTPRSKGARPFCNYDIGGVGVNYKLKPVGNPQRVGNDLRMAADDWPDQLRDWHDPIKIATPFPILIRRAEWITIAPSPAKNPKKGKETQ
jgi:hypothetical protein